MDGAPNFEPLPGARHKVEFTDGTEWIVVRASRNWFALPFLSVWLVGWTIGGIAAITAFSHGEEQGFIAIWLIFWAFGWAIAATTIFWQLGGRTYVGVKDGALTHRWVMPLLSRAKHYDAGQIRNLRPSSSPWSQMFAGFGRSPYPPFFPMGSGTVAFDYGARTVRLLPEIDEAEGQMIVEWLERRLPRVTH